MQHEAAVTHGHSQVTQMQFTTVRWRPGTTDHRHWSSLGRSGEPCACPIRARPDGRPGFLAVSHGCESPPKQLITWHDPVLGVLKKDPVVKTAPLAAFTGRQCNEFPLRHRKRAQQSLQYLPYICQLIGKLVSRCTLGFPSFLDELAQQCRPIVLAVENMSDRMMSIRLDNLRYAVADELVVRNPHAGTVRPVGKIVRGQ